MSRTPDRPDHPPFEEEKVQAAMPFPLQPTNLPGAYTTPAPPDDFDPYTASPRDLVRAGFLWRRPDAASRPEFREAWDLVMSRQWRREDRIVPTFEVRPGRTHHLRQRPVKEANGLYKFGNWAGAGKNGGNWSTVIGFWQVPAVSVPPEGPGPDGGRDSASWIGIDGFLGSTDVLQAGTS